MENKRPKRRMNHIGSRIIIAALLIVPMVYSCNNAPKEKGSNFGGVQIGVITYSWRSMPGGIENIIKYCKETGVTSIELMSGDLEEYLGAPENPMMKMFRRPPAEASAQTAADQPAPPPQRRRFEMTDEMRAQIEEYNQKLKEWRLSVPMSEFEEVRKMFDDEGISIHIVKFSPARWSDEEIDYAFKAAKAMGAKGVTEEIGEEAVERLAPFAEKHGMYAIFHNHMQFAEEGFSYDNFIDVSPAVMFNFDAVPWSDAVKEVKTCVNYARQILL